MKSLLPFFAILLLTVLYSCSTSRQNNGSCRVEKMDLWVGPKQIEDRCFHPLAPPDCKEKYYQIQKGNLDKNGTWKTFYSHDFQIPDYEQGYIYRVKYKRVKLPKVLIPADGSDYEVKGFEVVSRIKA